MRAGRLTVVATVTDGTTRGVSPAASRTAASAACDGREARPAFDAGSTVNAFVGPIDRLSRRASERLTDAQPATSQQEMLARTQIILPRLVAIDEPPSKAPRLRGGRGSLRLSTRSVDGTSGTFATPWCLPS